MANTYTLKLKIDALSLKIIKAVKLKITLAKPRGWGGHDVIWLVFDPYQENTVRFTDEYGLYASTNQSSQDGVVISKMSDIFPAQDAASYSFDYSGTFKGPFKDGGPPPGQYRIDNHMPSSLYQKLTFGLEQKACINGFDVDALPINAVIVPEAVSIMFAPLNTVLVWLQFLFPSGTIITDNVEATSVTFGGGIWSQTLTYNP
jgi:hypothetical protein